MAPPKDKPPVVLPANFDFGDSGGASTPPTVLPPNFQQFDGDTPSQATGQKVPQQILDTLRRNINSRAGGMGYDASAVPAPAKGDTGIIAGAVRGVKNMVGMGSAVFSGPQSPDEQAVVDAAKTNPIMGQSALAAYRLGVKPSLDAIDKANMYDLKAAAAPQGTATQTYSPQHMANAMRIGAVIPGVGPLAANLVERAGGGDVSGALTEGATYRGAANAVDAAANMKIPSTVRAGEAFQKVSGVVGDQPVNVGAAGDIALEASNLAATGTTLPKVLRDFISRVTDPTKGPLTFDEARNFQSNASRLSSAEYQRLTPKMQRQVAMFADEMGKATQSVADQGGVGQDFSGAMKEYGQAANNAKMYSGLKDALAKGAVKSIPYGIGGLLAGAGYKLTR